MTCKKPKKKYGKHVKDGEVSGCLFGHKYYNLRPELFPSNKLQYV
jgi:hypothetical protein